MNNKELFLEKAVKLHNDKYDYSNINYINSKTKVSIICPEHGVFLQIPSSHLQGTGCSKCAKETRGNTTRWTKDQFIENANKAHTVNYDYTKVNYKTNKTKVTIVCPVHGEFQQLPYMHLRGHGCNACARIATGKINAKSTKDFILEAQIVHKEVYSYHSTVYKGALTKVRITCPMHGEFTQRPSDHLAGAGCPECAKQNQGWTYTSWEKAGQRSKNFTGYKLYIIQCWDNNEQFIKIGKTFTDISKRFLRMASMPYEWKVLKIEEGSARYISTLENTLHTKYKAYKYSPNIPFGGETECFNSLTPIESMSRLSPAL